MECLKIDRNKLMQLLEGIKLSEKVNIDLIRNDNSFKFDNTLYVIVKYIDSNGKEGTKLMAKGETFENANSLKINQMIEVKQFRNIPIVDISCGKHHMLLITALGQVYARGNNKYGQLGFENKKRIKLEPYLVLSRDIN